MKILVAILPALFLLSCNKGIWKTDHTYRPKHPKFSILKKTPFVSDSLIDVHYLYIQTKAFQNYDGKQLSGYMGFYPDGKMIVDLASDAEIELILRDRNSFEKAASIGYYTTDHHKISVEYFLPEGGGVYQKRIGVVKPDTLIFEAIFETSFFKKTKRYDTLVRSKYPLQ